MSLVLRKTRQFEKDVKRMAKRGMPLRELTGAIDLLLAESPLPENTATIPWSGSTSASANATSGRTGC